MATRKTTEVRSTGVRIPDICFGTSALGNMPDTYTYEVDEKRAVETIKTICTILSMQNHLNRL